MSANANPPVRVSDRIESALRWLVAYPVYTLVIVLIFLTALGGLGSELGVEHLFWSGNPAVQVLAGYFVGLLVAATLFVLFLVNRPALLVGWLDRRLGSPFPSADPVVKQLGAFLLWGMLAVLVALVALKVGLALSVDASTDSQRRELEKERDEVSPTDPRRADLDGLIDQVGTRGYLRERAYLWPFALGYVLSIGFAYVLHRFDETRRPRPLRQRLLDRTLFGHPLRARLEGRGVPEAEHGVHGAALYLFGVTVLVLSLLLALVARGEMTGGELLILVPVPLACTVTILASQVYGVFRFYVRRQLLLFLALVSVPVLFNSTRTFEETQYKLTFPGLSDGPRGRTPLWHKDDTKDPSALGKTYHDTLALSARYAGENLIPSEEPVRAMAAARARDHNNEKPKLVFVCVSGGGIRAAVWVGTVLARLDTDVPGFRRNVRMITGASGGMVAAALYVADFENGFGDPHIDALATDSLSRTAQALVLRDLAWNTTFVPPWEHATRDRGRTLEDEWGRAAQRRLGRNPFAVPVVALRAAERTGARPSLVLSPMLVEDSRRLLVSNLDLDDMTHTATGTALEHDGITAVEFHRLFPALAPDEAARAGWPYATSHGFAVGTAARMSATFPVISPVVSLPTTPARRVVDAGYYDNCGVSLAAEWMLKHDQVLREETAGVALVEIRAFPLYTAGLQFGMTDSQTGEVSDHDRGADLFTDLTAAVSVPLGAVLAARGNITYHRNMGRVERLHNVFNRNPKVPRADRFFFHCAIELTRPAALNWYLTDVEKNAVRLAYSRKGVTEQVAELRKWFGTGGGK